MERKNTRDCCTELRGNSSGGTYQKHAALQGSMAACEVESSGASRLLVGGLAAGPGTSGQVSVLDLSTAQCTQQVRRTRFETHFQPESRSISKLSLSWSASRATT